MEVTTKSRAELKARFVKNSIPTETDFANLIDGLFNLQDDGVVKSAGNPLSIQADGESSGPQKVLNLYSSLKDANPAWTLSLNPRSDPANANSARSGFNLGDGSGASRLFIDRTSGNVGVGTITPGAKLEVNGTLTANGATTLNGAVAVGSAQAPQPLTVTGATTLTGNVSVGTASSLSFGNAVRQMINLWSTGYGIGVQNNTQYFRSDRNFAWYKGGSHHGDELNAGTNGTAQMVIKDGNVGIGTADPGNKLHIDKGRVDITTSDDSGGGQNRFSGLTAWNATTAYRRGQLVLSSSYSDLVIASSKANDNHGSTLTFATADPNDATKYRKWVINQGNWGARKQFLDFGYSDAESRANPHDNINGTDTVLTLDGVNKRVGIGTTSPGQKLTISGSAQHLLLRREATETQGGKLVFLELYQADDRQPKVPEIYPSIRFHHGNRFWHRIEARSDGFHLKEGYLENDGYVSLQVGTIFEKLDVIQCNRRDDWTAQNHPIMLYFKTKLQGKSIGTMVRAIQDHPSWRGHYWQGWVDADGRIRVIHNYHNTTAVVV